METIKKFVNVIVMLYLIAATLIYLDILKLGQDTNPNFNTTFYLIGGVILLLELIVENLYIASLKREFSHSQHKINELKALLYDQKQEMHQSKSNSTTPNQADKPATNTPATPAPGYDRNTIIVKPGSIAGNSNPNSGNRPTGNPDAI